MGCFRRLPAPRNDRETEETQSCRAQRRIEQSRHFRLGYGMRAFVRSVLVVSLTTAFAAQAQTPPLPDKPFAEHRLVMQLSDNTPDKEALVLSVANNLLKAYDPDKIAIVVVGFGP